MLSRLMELEKEQTSGGDSRRRYLEMHEPRFAGILRICRTLVPDSAARVLDVGRSELTASLSSFYRDVLTLGLDPNKDDGGHREMQDLGRIPHITFDLLNAATVADWPDCGTFDLVILSEVIEHLHIAPAFVLAFLGSLLSYNGFLVCTTPNATAISKRIRMCIGRNPYEQLRLYSRNPGHIREYTRKELFEIAGTVGLDCRSHCYSNWIKRKEGNQLRRIAVRFVNAYPAFRPFQTFVFVRKRRSSTAL